MHIEELRQPIENVERPVDCGDIVAARHGHIPAKAGRWSEYRSPRRASGDEVESWQCPSERDRAQALPTRNVVTACVGLEGGAGGMSPRKTPRSDHRAAVYSVVA